MGINLRPYQAGVRPAVEKYIRANKGKNPLVALPTGSGKSYCIADIIKSFHNKWKTKVLVLSHVKEILQQNHKSIAGYTGLEIGLYSAGLKSKDIKPITVAGIQSVFRRADEFKDHKLIIVDEAHLIPQTENSMYRTFLDALPNSIVVGFTGTPFRLGTGYIFGPGNEHVFDDMVYDWTSKEKFNELVEDGYLSPLTSERTEMELDTSGITLKGGDYAISDMSSKFDRKAVTNAAIKEIMKAGENREQWMVFAIDIAHAEHIAETLIRNGIKTAVVHSQMADDGFDRDKVIKDVRDNKYKCVVNVDILTIGFDNPRIDLIALLRPTKSPVLHVQILGRGSRVCDGKSDCLVLDFAGNVARLGPINDVQLIIKGKGKGDGEPITKPCPRCNLIVHAAARVCERCGFKFPREHHLNMNADTIAIIDDGNDHWVQVYDVAYEHNQNVGRPDTLIVNYKCGMKVIKEHICMEHTGFAKHKADHWVKFRGGDPKPTVAEFFPQAEKLRKPNQIRVSKKGAYYTIKDSLF